jgi:transposase
MFLGGEVEVDGSYYCRNQKEMQGRGVACKVPLFDILERGGRFFVQVVFTTQAKDVLTLTVKKVRRGSIVYTDQ